MNIRIELDTAERIAQIAGSLPSADHVASREAVAQDLEGMLDAFDLKRLREIDRLLRALPEAQATPEDVEQMLSVVLAWGRSGQGREGFPISVKAVRIARALDNTALLRRSLTFRGSLAITTLDVGIAVDCLLEAMQLAEVLNDVLGVVLSLKNLGLCCSLVSLNVASLRCDRRALSIAQQWREKSGDNRATYAESLILSGISNTLLRVEDSRGALQAARLSQQLGRQVLPCLPPPRKAQIEDAMALARCNEVSALTRLGMCDVARTVAASLDLGSAANWRGSWARIALAELDAATGNRDRAIEELQRVAMDPAAKLSHREAMALLVSCYESNGSPDEALLVLQKLQTEIEAARREVALEELQYIEGIDPEEDDAFEEVTRSRIADYRVAVDGIGARLSSKIQYLNELAVSAEIREGSEGDRAEHIYRVGALSSLLAAEAGCGEELCWLAEVAGRLHDIGKISIPDVIALPPRSLSAGEWEIVRGHSNYGARLIADADEPRLVQVVAAVRHHHERFGGGGYPSNLKAEEIPLLARIVAISESFDAMLQSRTFRPCRSIPAALEEIERGAGSWYDPRLAGLFVQIVRRLQREVDDLRAHLGERGRSSSAVQTFAKLSGLFN